MLKSINTLLAKVAHQSHETLSFPFSRRIGDDWYDIACDGHRILAVEAAEPHYSREGGPESIDNFLATMRVKFRFDGTAREELVATAKACPKYKNRTRTLRLRHADGVSAVVNPDLLLDILTACEEDAIVVSVRGELDPVRVDGIRSASVGDHYQRVFGVVMPMRSAQEELPGLEQFRLTYDLPEQMYGSVDLHVKAKGEAA